MRTSRGEDRLGGDLGEDGLGEVGRLGVATHVTGSDGSLLAVDGEEEKTSSRAKVSDAAEKMVRGDVART